MRSSYPEAVGTPDTIINSTSFWHFSDSFRRFVSSSRSSEEDMLRLAKDCRNCYTVSVVISAGNTTWLTTCNLSCQNSFSFALSRKGNSRTWWTKRYRRIGSSESKGETSPKSDLKGAPNLCNAVGELSSVISNLTCWDMSSRFRSTGTRQIYANTHCDCRPTMLLLSRKRLSSLQGVLNHVRSSILCHLYATKDRDRVTDTLRCEVLKYARCTIGLEEACRFVSRSSWMSAVERPTGASLTESLVGSWCCKLRWWGRERMRFKGSQLSANTQRRRQLLSYGVRLFPGPE